MYAHLGCVCVQKPHVFVCVCKKGQRWLQLYCFNSSALPWEREAMLYPYKAYLYLNKPVPDRFNSAGLKNKHTVLN